MTDLVERLCIAYGELSHQRGVDVPELAEAADEIERLQADLTAEKRVATQCLVRMRYLRAALERIVREGEMTEPRAVSIARDALRAEEDRGG
jgi:hypothetical protein